MRPSSVTAMIGARLFRDRPFLALRGKFDKEATPLDFFIGLHNVMAAVTYASPVIKVHHVDLKGLGLWTKE